MTTSADACRFETELKRETHNAGEFGNIFQEDPLGYSTVLVSVKTQAKDPVIRRAGEFDSFFQEDKFGYSTCFSQDSS